MPTPFYLTGWEHGVATLTTNGGGLISFISSTATVSVVSAEHRTGSYCLKCAPTASVDAYIRWSMGGQQVIVGRFYFKIETEPAVASRIWSNTMTTGTTTTNARIYIDPATDKIELRVGSGTVVATSSNTYTVGQWHRLDFSITTSANPWVMKAQLDGGTEFSGNGSTAADSMTNHRIGNDTAEAMVIYYDDYYISVTGADYPIGPGGTELLKPDSDGTHNAGTNIMEDNAGTDIGTTTAYDKLNSVPPSSTTYVRQATVSTTHYAEVNFSDMVASYGSILGAMGLLVYTSASTATNEAGCIISKDAFSTQSEVWGNPTTRQDYSDGNTGNLFYKRALIANVDGSNVNSLQARVGYSNDVTPNPYWIDLYVEIAYSEPAGAAKARPLFQKHTPYIWRTP